MTNRYNFTKLLAGIWIIPFELDQIEYSLHGRRAGAVLFGSRKATLTAAADHEGEISSAAVRGVLVAEMPAARCGPRPPEAHRHGAGNTGPRQSQ